MYEERKEPPEPVVVLFTLLLLVEDIAEAFFSTEDAGVAMDRAEGGAGAAGMERGSCFLGESIFASGEPSSWDILRMWAT